MNIKHNPPLPVQFLRSGFTLQDLEDQFDVAHRRHNQLPNLVTLKYDIKANFRHEIVRQCRGIILDESNNWNVVAYPFDKFFNHDEPLAAKIDWPSARVLEKLDGSLMIMYYYGGVWRAATSGMPDAAGQPSPIHNKTFAELFWETFAAKGYRLPDNYCTNITYMFEFTSPYNHIVVPHQECNLRLIGVRQRDTGVEYRSTTQNYEMVNEYGLRSLPSTLASLAMMDPLYQEGYVVVDRHFNRVKIKHPGYVVLHQMRSSMSIRNAVRIIQAGKPDDIPKLVATFPQWSAMFTVLQYRLNKVCEDIQANWDLLQHLDERKDFALAACATKHSAILFMMLDKKVTTPREGLKQLNVDHVMELMEVDKMKLPGAFAMPQEEIA